MPDFLLPDLGEGLEDAELLSWRVAVGDTVAVDQVVAEVETAKTAVEVPSPFAGVVTALHAEAGEVVQVGRPLLTVEPAPIAAQGFREPGVVTERAESGSGAVLVGYGTAETASRRRRRRAPAAVSANGHGAGVDVNPLAPDGDTSYVTPDGDASAGRREGPVPVISPLVRRMARDAGLDLRAVAASGPQGLVLRRDVEAAIAARSDSAPAARVRVTPEAGGVRRVALRGARRVAAERLSRSRREIPEATVWVDLDATQLLAARRELNAAPGTAPVSLLGLLARFTVLGLRRYPELNGRIEGDELVIPDAVHLGFAAQTPRGLVVPVVREAQSLPTRELSAALTAATAAAREGTLAPEQLSGGTFTVNNYGVFGVDGSAAIINHPEVAILGMGRVMERPWVVEGALAVRAVTELTLSFDHRACDGGVAGGFLRYVADCLESPLRALGDL